MYTPKLICFHIILSKHNKLNPHGFPDILPSSPFNLTSLSPPEIKCSIFSFPHLKTYPLSTSSLLFLFMVPFYFAGFCFYSRLYMQTQRFEVKTLDERG